MYFVSFSFLSTKTDTSLHLSFNEIFVNWTRVRAQHLISALKGLKKYASSEACSSVWYKAVLLKINQLYLNAIPQAHHIFRKRMKKKSQLCSHHLFLFYCSGFLFNHLHENAKHFSSPATLKTSKEDWNEPHREG